MDYSNEKKKEESLIFNTLKHEEQAHLHRPRKRRKKKRKGREGCKSSGELLRRSVSKYIHERGMREEEEEKEED